MLTSFYLERRKEIDSKNNVDWMKSKWLLSGYYSKDNSLISGTLGDSSCILSFSENKNDLEQEIFIGSYPLLTYARGAHSYFLLNNSSWGNSLYGSYQIKNDTVFTKFGIVSLVSVFPNTLAEGEHNFFQTLDKVMYFVKKNNQLEGFYDNGNKKMIFYLKD